MPSFLEQVLAMQSDLREANLLLHSLVEVSLRAKIKDEIES
jgi:hypothetical protein